MGIRSEGKLAKLLVHKSRRNGYELLFDSLVGSGKEKVHKDENYKVSILKELSGG